MTLSSVLRAGSLRGLLLLAALALLVLVFARACASGDSLGSVGDACFDDRDCASGLCIASQCADRAPGQTRVPESGQSGIGNSNGPSSGGSSSGEPGSGDDYLEPCQRDEDCSSGLCISSPIGRVCTRLCLEDEECDRASDWRCRRIQGDRDLTQICYPDASDLCSPCTADTDCGEVRDTCVELLNGRFCGIDCAQGGICPDGYFCSDLGEGTAQCVPLEQRCGECRDADLLTDPDNCGDCGVRCNFDNGNAECINGECVLVNCRPGFDNCDGRMSTGCEANTRTDASNCGSCGVSCPGDQPCQGGVCSCGEGRVLCDGECRDANVCGGCEDLAGARPGDSCGPCGNDELVCRTEDRALRCENTSTAQPGDSCGQCNAGNRECDAAGFLTCANEPDLQSSRRHCGECGVPCDGLDQFCDKGVCVCNDQSLRACGQDCVNTDANNNHCGSCNNRCDSPRTCIGGECRCPSGQEFCNGACVSLTTSQNCGSCGNICTGDLVCRDGGCRCPLVAGQNLNTRCGNQCYFLGGIFNEDCGLCGNGSNVCLDGAVICVGATTNACGGCTNASRTQNSNCFENDAQCATWQCVSDEVTCVPNTCPSSRPCDTGSGRCTAPD